MLTRHLTQTMPLVTSRTKTKGNFWSWMNTIFNRVNKSRLRKVGHERLCTEWLLKHGAVVCFTVQPNKIYADPDILPSDKLPFPFELKEVIADNAGIMANGFQHFVGCKHIDTMRLVNCEYIDDEALARLEILSKSLKDLVIINCENVTTAGLISLAKLTNLEKLRVANMPLVRNYSTAKDSLSKALPNCKLYFK